MAGTCAECAVDLIDTSRIISLRWLTLSVAPSHSSTLRLREQDLGDQQVVVELITESLSDSRETQGSNETIQFVLHFDRIVNCVCDAFGYNLAESLSQAMDGDLEGSIR